MSVSRCLALYCNVKETARYIPGSILFQMHTSFSQSVSRIENNIDVTISPFTLKEAGRGVKWQTEK